MQQNWKFQRGDIFFTHFGASTGSEQCGDRPAVILQNDVGNYHSPTLIVATMTSKAEKKVNQPTHCLLENAGLNMPSVVQAEQIFTIDKSRALKYLGHLTPEEMREVGVIFWDAAAQAAPAALQGKVLSADEQTTMAAKAQVESLLADKANWKLAEDVGDLMIHPAADAAGTVYEQAVKASGCQYYVIANVTAQ